MFYKRNTWRRFGIQPKWRVMISNSTGNIAVIGASGFIGRHFIDALQKKKKVNLILWDKKKDGTFLDAGNREAFLINNSIDIIFNFAWSPIGTDRYDEDYGNFDFAEATVAFTRLCQTISVPVVVIGSTIANTEKVNTPYSFSKKFLQEVYRAERPKNVCLVKPTYLFSLKYLRPRILRKYFELNEANKLQDFKIDNPHEYLRVLHVQDFASGLLSINHDFESYAEFEISSGYEIKVVNFIHLVAHFSNPTKLNKPFVSFEREREIRAETIISNKISKAFLMGNHIEELQTRL